MARLDGYLQEAVRFPQDPSSQRSLALFPFLEESLGFLQVCHVADAARRVVRHQCRMYYREKFELWYNSIEAYLHDRKVPLPVRTFLTDTIWDNNPPQLASFWFPTMKEVVFLTYIVEEIGCPVWTADRCDAFFYHLQRPYNKSPHQINFKLSSVTISQVV